MWLELFIIPLLIVIILFVIFWIVHEGSRWQKHKYLGGFARFIQVSAGRSFMTFLVLTILTFPTAMLVMTGMWWDRLDAGVTPEKTDVVNVMLLMFLLLAFTISVLWGSFRTWRHSVRAVAEESIRLTE